MTPPSSPAPGKPPAEDDAPWISDDLIPDSLEPGELSPTIARPDADSSQLPKQHSAELFPVPPAGELAAQPSVDASATQSSTADSSQAHRSAVGPLPLVETAFLASAASLMWLINTYFPPGPLLRILFPLPIALVYLRWDVRAAWMAATVSGLLLTILLGPTRSIFFVMPYGLLGVQLGCLWRRKAGWGVSILTGGLLVALGSFFRIWLLSLLAGEDLWGYSIAQITQLLNWVIRVLTNWGWISLGAFGQPGLGVVSIAAVAMVVFASVVYLFTVHLAAWLVLDRLGVAMPEPPGWVQVLIEE
ncbi:MAG: DUF2232 domain-containing protein [Phormidesmis sp.]